jgi:hypothetical protein
MTERPLNPMLRAEQSWRRQMENAGPTVSLGTRFRGVCPFACATRVNQPIGEFESTHPGVYASFLATLRSYYSSSPRLTLLTLLSPLFSIGCVVLPRTSGSAATSSSLMMQHAQFHTSISWIYMGCGRVRQFVTVRNSFRRIKGDLAPPPVKTWGSCMTCSFHALQKDVFKVGCICPGGELLVSSMSTVSSYFCISKNSCSTLSKVGCLLLPPSWQEE